MVTDPVVESFGSAGIAMAVVGVDGRLTAVNSALCDLLGSSGTELLDRSLAEVTGATGGAPEALVPDGQDRHVSERQLPGRAGSGRWVRITASHTTEHRPGPLLAILEDVTERRHAEQRVRAQRERLEALVVAQHAVATAGLDLDPVMSVVAEHALRLTGAEGSVVELVDGDEMVYRAAAGSTAPFVGVRLPVSDSLSGRCVTERETLICLDSELDDRVNAAGCQRIGVRSMAVVPLFRAGQAVGALKVTSAEVNRFGPEDVQALQLMAGLVAAALAQAQAFAHAETLVAELDKRQEFLAAVLESTQAGIVACDDLGRLTLSNGTARTWHGVDAEAGLDPESWSDDLYEVDGVTPLPAARIPLVRALRDGQVTDAELWISRHGGPTGTRVLCQGRRLQLGERVLGAVVVMHDITAAHERELALAQARDEALAGTRAKTAFLAAASHEIRTPLNGVLGTLELLDLAGLDPQQRSYVEVARRSSEALLSLLNDVLDLSKAEATRVVLKDAPFSPNEVGADVAAALASVAQTKQLQLHFEPGAECLLMGDADRLRQILMNLVGNAVKFTSAGRISIAASVEPSLPEPPPGTASAAGPRRYRLSFAVSDSGPGIAGDELRRVFQPFEQGAQGQRFGGTGLGLALSQELTELMGGCLQVDSTLGTGSTFTLQVTLVGHEPRVTEVAGRVRRPAAGLDTGHADEDGPGRRLRVLVADDVEVNRMVARALLVAEGAHVVCVDDGDEAVLALQAEPFDLVLLDNRMPRMSGIDAARAIRRLDGPAGLTRLVALTASASDEDRAAFERAGMQDVLLKPVRGRDLRAALQAV